MIEEPPIGVGDPLFQPDPRAPTHIAQAACLTFHVKFTHLTAIRSGGTIPVWAVDRAGRGDLLIGGFPAGSQDTDSA